MRTQEEIINRIKEIEKEDFFGFEQNDLISFLHFENAKQFLKEKTTKNEWNKICEKKSPKEIMIDYMPFAWEKANNFRGLSASRSMSHYRAWLWLDGDEKIWPKIFDYEFYGKDKLVLICKYLGLDSKKWDDGIRSNQESH